MLFLSCMALLLFARVPVDEEEDEERPNQGAPSVHRAVFPRDFGRQNAKDVERRVELVIGCVTFPGLASRSSLCCVHITVVGHRHMLLRVTDVRPMRQVSAGKTELEGEEDEGPPFLIQDRGVLLNAEVRV